MGERTLAINMSVEAELARSSTQTHQIPPIGMGRQDKKDFGFAGHLDFG